MESDGVNYGADEFKDQRSRVSEEIPITDVGVS